MFIGSARLHGRARIETIRRKQETYIARCVAPGFTAGRGLKQQQISPFKMTDAVAPGFTAGRGLKPNYCQQCCNCMLCSARLHGRARIETGWRELPLRTCCRSARLHGRARIETFMGTATAAPTKEIPHKEILPQETLNNSSLSFRTR